MLFFNFIKVFCLCISLLCSSEVFIRLPVISRGISHVIPHLLGHFSDADVNSNVRKLIDPPADPGIPRLLEYYSDVDVNSNADESIDPQLDHGDNGSFNVTTVLSLTIQDHLEDFFNDEALENVLEYNLLWQTFYYGLLPVLAVLVSCLLYFVYSRLKKSQKQNDHLKMKVNHLMENEEVVKEEKEKLEYQNDLLEMEVIRVQDLLNKEKKDLKTLEENYAKALKNSSKVAKELMKENTSFRSETKNLANMLYAAETEIREQELQLLQKDRHQEQLSQKLGQQKLHIETEATHNQEILQRECRLKEEVEHMTSLLKTQEEDYKCSLKTSQSTIQLVKAENTNIKAEMKNVADRLEATKIEIKELQLQLLQKDRHQEQLSQELDQQKQLLESEATHNQEILQRECRLKEEVEHMTALLKTQEEDYKCSLKTSQSTIQQVKAENTNIEAERKNVADRLEATKIEIKELQLQLLQKDQHQEQLSQELNQQKQLLESEATHNQEILQRECRLKKEVEHMTALLKTQEEDYKCSLNIQQLKAEKAKEQGQLNAKLEAHKLLVDGLLFFNENEMDKAVMKLNLSIQQYPLGVALMTRAKVYKAIGSFEDALQDSLRAQTLENTNADHYLFTAKIYIAVGKPQEALNTLNYLRDDLGMTLGEFGSPFQKLFEKATHLQIYIDRALQSDAEKALHLWEKALALAPASSYLKLQAAQAYLLSDRLDHAKELVEEICKEKTQNVDAHYMLGLIHFYMGEYQQAIDIFNHTSLNGYEKAKKASLILQQSLLYQEGEYYMQKEHYEKALSSFSEALEMGLIDQEDYKNLLYARAVVSVILGDHQTAAEDTSEILEMDNKYLPARTVRILCSVALGHYHQASSDIENMATSFDEDFVEDTRHLLEIATTDDYYASLGLDIDCTDDDIRKAFRKAALLHHPDKLSHVSEEIRSQHEEEMKRITTAYRILADKTEKQHYDVQQANFLGYSDQWQKHLTKWIIEEYVADHAGDSCTPKLPL